MSEPIDEDELQRDLNHALKSVLVKTLISNQDLGASWIDPLHDSTEEMHQKDKEHRQVLDDYYEHNDWEHNADYQKAMKIPLDKLGTYGLDGKDDSEQLKAEQKRFDFEEDHPILSKFF